MYERKIVFMNDYLLIIGKTILFIIVTIVILKIMGKRELGQLNSFDIVIFFVISELFSLSIEEPHDDIMKVLIPIIVICLMQVISSYIVLKSNKVRKLIEENPTIVINDGDVDIKIMKKLRYNIDDLMEQLRINGIDSVINVKFAILESNGTLSVIEKDKDNSKVPFSLIKDGIIDEKVLEILNKDRNWLIKELNKKGYKDEKEIFMCFFSVDESLFIIEKEKIRYN